MKKILLPLAVLLLLPLAYLLLWPVPISPVAWTPPPAPALEGVYAANDKLRDVQRFGVDVGIGPEGIAIDAAGRIYVGYLDGRIVMFSANGASYQELGKTEGRPLGVSFGPNGGLVIADATLGLLHLGDGTTPKVLAAAADGVPLALADDVDNTRLDKNLYFTDAAAYPLSQVFAEFLEHKGTGRLMQYNATTKETKVLMKGLMFANGVAVGPDDAYVLVNETAAYRVMRYWLKGDKAGTSEVFIDNLPGLPDNISFNEDHRRFWLALYSPRSAALDDLADKPAWLKKLVFRIPDFLKPMPHKAWVLGIDENGKVIANLQHDAKEAYGPITSVREYGPWLIFGSLSANSLARLPLNAVFPGSPPPPTNWKQLKPNPHHFVPPKVEDEGEMAAEEDREKK